MRKLVIDQTDTTPLVILDPAGKNFQISGQSRPSDVREFYDQIISWFDDFNIFLKDKNNNFDGMIFTFNLDYFNSSSAKLIVDVCKSLSILKQRGLNVSVKWCYEEEDTDMLEAGKEISRIVNCPFEYVESPHK
jgi:hypothetical protein